MKNRILFSRLRSVACISVICLLASCADDTPKPAATSTEPTSVEQKETQGKDACSLLTQADAKAILEIEVKPGMQTSSMCQYLSTSEELSKAGESVSLEVHKNAGSEFDKYVSDMASSTGVISQPVSGVGQKAAWAEGALVVQQGNDLLLLIIGKKLEKETHLAVAKSLANSVISRMN